MDILSKHTIKQQILDITIPNADDHEEITNALSEVYKQNIDGMLADSCDGLIAPNEIVRIDSLTVDLGHIPFEQLETEFPKAVKNAVREVLFQKLRDKEISPARSGKATERKKVEALLFYLATGLLPWYYEDNLQKLEREFSTKRIIVTDTFLRTLKSLESRKRAVQFFDEKVLVNFLLEKLPAEKRILLDQLKVLSNCLRKLETGSEALYNRITKTSKMLLQSLKPKEETYCFVMEQFIQLAIADPTQSVKNLPAVLPMKFHTKLQSLLQSLPQSDEWTKGNLFSKEEFAFLETLRATFEPKSQEETPLKKIKKEFEVTEKLELKGGVTIENAGLILVWPYLEAFFTGLGLMSERSFIDSAAKINAVHLLHYLVFKTEVGDETDWLLSKILCGIEPTEFIPDNFDLDLAHKEECEHLLNAIISNWPALKNTSADSLRNTFLQRDGLLEPYENGWILKIERKAYDILLDRLTWAISVVKMPWNDYLITTEW